MADGGGVVVSVMVASVVFGVLVGSFVGLAWAALGVRFEVALLVAAVAGSLTTVVVSGVWV